MLPHHLISGSGQAFIFQHGLGSQVSQPQNLLSGLQDIQLISMDCPGHGQSPLPDGVIPSFNYYADQLVELLDEIQVKKAIFGGISMGAGIAVNMALRYPDRVQGMVLIRPAWLAEKYPGNLKILLTAAQYMQNGGGKGPFEQLEDFQAIARPLPKAGSSVLGVFSATQRPEIATVLKAMVGDAPFETLDSLAHIKQPCLIIGNENDPLHPLQIAESWHRALPYSQLFTVISRYVDNDQHSQSIHQIVSNFIQTL